MYFEYKYLKRKSLTAINIAWQFPSKTISASFQISPLSQKFLSCLWPPEEILNNKAYIMTNVPNPSVGCHFYNPSFVEPFSPFQEIFFELTPTEEDPWKVSPSTFICPTSFPAVGWTACKNRFLGTPGDGLYFFDSDSFQYVSIAQIGEIVVADNLLRAPYEYYEFFFPYEKLGNGTLEITYQ